MKEISKIILKSTSGYCSIQDSYSDKLVITDNSISYEKNGYEITIDGTSSKWSYKTNSELFSSIFSKMANEINKIINRDELIICCDAGTIDFSITFIDGTKFTESYSNLEEQFRDLFLVIRELVPSTEEMPEILKLEEDFEE